MNELERILTERLISMERRLAAMERRESTIGGLPSGGAAGGDLSGTYPNPRVVALADKYMFGFVTSYDGTQQTTIGFDGTNTFTLAPTGTTWSYYRNGIKYTVAGSKTVALSGSPPAAAGLYYIYIDSTDGSLTASTVGWTLEDTKVPVATVAWNNALTPKYWLSNERHTVAIDRRYHFEHHFSDGTEVITAPALSGHSVAPVSPADTNNTFGISESVTTDEDLKHVLTALTDPNGTATDYVVWYRTAASAWSWAASAMPYRYTAAGYIQYDASGTMTEGQNAKYYNTYLLLTNIAGAARFALVHGQAEFASLSAAQAESFGALTKTGISINEFVAVYQLTWETSASYTTKGKCRLAAAPKAISVAASGASTMVSMDHGALTGLGDDDHTQYILHSLATAASDFLVASGSGAFVKKTLAEVKTVLSLGSAAYTASTDYAVAAKGVTNGDSHDHAGGDGAQVDHGGLGGLSDDDHSIYHTDSRGDARYPLKATSVTYYVRTTGNDGNTGLSSGAALLTIQAAINKFKGRVLSACVIDVGVGTYTEDLDISGMQSTVADLKITGDSAKTTVGTTFIHGVSNYVDMANCGVGAVTLATDNSGTGGRIRITVTRATTNPNFQTDGIDNTNKVLTWDGTTLTEFAVYSVSSNVITLASTAGAPSLATAGRCFVICPNVILVNSSTHAITAYSAFLMRGLYVKSSNRCLSVVGAQTAGCYCVLNTSSATSFESAVYVTNAGAFYAFEPPSSYNMAVSGYGKHSVFVASANSILFLGPNAVGCSITGSFVLHVSARSYGAHQYSAFPINGGTGVYASTGSYVNALSSSAKNFCTTKYSPATTDTAGNYSAIISQS